MDKTNGVGPTTHVSQPLQVMVDIQLGPDGHPWIRLQFATIGMSTSVVMPHESSEDVIAMISTGIRKAAASVGRKQEDTVMPDFSNIKPIRPGDN